MDKYKLKVIAAVCCGVLLTGCATVSIGGGYVFVTDGAVNFVWNESEFAAILAHELGHELAGHFCEASGLSNSGGLFDIFSASETQQHQVGVGSMTQVVDRVKEQQAD